ncbi:type II toxin-antitoxin system RelE/ParE family toxin [Pseudomonas sp. NPDC078700]|uniref:type II toxin-antitoxin system RelE/ParE family toxin n=1 Tax=Pseudomonas sp. NPDC078700 TaxID=3364424 RepID=UPI0037C9C918
MILNFRCADTRALYEAGGSRRWKNIGSVATRKLSMLQAAAELRDLRSPPRNRLEVMHGRRAGQYSIRINHQSRICFEWTEAGPMNVEVID